MTREKYQSFQLGWTLRVTLKRLIFQWRSLLTTAVGILLATLIGASIPLYSSAVGQVGLQQTLSSTDRSIVNITIRTGEPGLTRESAARFDDASRSLVGDRLGEWTQAVVSWEETLPLPPEIDNTVIPGTRLRLGYFQDWQQHVTVEAGSLPTGKITPGIDVDAVAGVDLARELGLKVGDIFLLRDSRESSAPIVVRVSGLVSPSDRDEAYWPSNAPPMQPAEPVGQWETQGTLLIDEDAFYTLATQYLPGTTSNLGWRVLIDHRSITLANIPEINRAIADVKARQEEIGAQFIDLETGLDDLLMTYEQEAKLLAAPFGLLIIQIVALTLYFLLITAELVRQHERREISLMKSRGGNSRQVWVLRALEALIICVMMSAIAPFIAQAGLRRISILGPLSGLDMGSIPLPLTLTPFVYAAAAGLASWALLMVTLRPLLNAPLITAAGVFDRPEKRAWWQRYYVDIGLLVLGGIAYWQLSSYGSVLIRSIGGGLVIDPLLLMTPSLLMLAIGALLLRLFSPVMNFLSFLLSQHDGITFQMAGWQISRRPVHYGRISLMLALAIGMGWFATSFNATVVKSRADRAEYQVGADLRIEQMDTLLDQPRTFPDSAYKELDGVNQASVAFRSRINASTRSGRTVFGELLAVNPDTFGLATEWREDLGVLAVPGFGKSAVETPGRILAPTPFRLGLWASMPDTSAEELTSRVAFSIKVLDDEGVMVNIPLEPRIVEQTFLEHVTDEPYERGNVFVPSGWVYLEANIAGTDRPLTAPLRLLSIHWVHRGALDFGGRHKLNLADLNLIDREGYHTEVDWLESLVGLRFQDDGVSLSEGSIANDTVREGSDGVEITWYQEGRTSSMGIVLDTRPSGSLPAIVSKSFLQANGLSGQEPFQLTILDSRLLFRVVAVMDYYPSLYATDRPFLVTNRDQLLRALNFKPSATFAANEVWLALEDRQDGERVVSALDNDDENGMAVSGVWNAVTLERQMQNNPLTIGLTGLFYIAFGVAMLLSAVSLLSYISLTAQARRVEFSIFQSIGKSTKSLIVSLAAEQLLVLGSGTLVGALLGALLGNQVLPFLSVTEGGKVIVPPFIVATDPELLAGYALILLGIFVFLLLSSLWLLRKMPLARTLRLGDE